MNKQLWYFLGIAGAIVAGIFLYQYVADLRAERDKANQNAANARDTLRITITTTGEVVEKYARQANIADSARKADSTLSHQKLLAESRVIANLEDSLAGYGNVDVTESPDEETLQHTFTLATRDSGATVSVVDSVLFSKLKDSAWVAQNWIRLDVSLSLINRITRDKNGLISGSVETRSKIVKIGSLETIIDDSFVPSPPSVVDVFRWSLHAGISSHLNAMRGTGELWYKQYGAGVDVGQGGLFFRLGYQSGLSF